MAGYTLKPKETTHADMANGITIENGSMLVEQDSARVSFDLNGSRVTIDGVINLANEAERTALLAPIYDKLYFVRNTEKLWVYKHNSQPIVDYWVCLNTHNYSELQNRPAFVGRDGVDVSVMTLVSSGATSGYTKYTYTIKGTAATAEALGVVKIGDGITVAADGTISVTTPVNAANVKTALGVSATGDAGKYLNEQGAFTEPSGSSGVGHSIFEIFYSLSSTTPPGAMDLSLGTLITSCNTLYPDFWTACVARKNAGTIRCLTESAWQAELTAYGSCGAFVVDTSNYSVRLPKIVDYLRSGTDDQLGTYQEEGLPNISGGVTGYLQGASGAFYLTAGWSSGPTTQSNEPYARGLHLDASRSSSIYGKSTHVQPKTVHARLFIQVYTEAVPASTAQAANFVNALQSKVDASQVPAAARNRVWISSALTQATTLYQVTHNLALSTLDLQYARCKLVAKCLTSQFGYAAGSWARILVGTSGTIKYPTLTASTISGRFGAFCVSRLDSTAVAAITAANWELHFVIFY